MQLNKSCHTQKMGESLWVEWAKACNFTNFPPVLTGPKNTLRVSQTQKSPNPKNYPTLPTSTPKVPIFKIFEFWAEKAYPKCLFWVPFRFLSIILSFRFSYREYGVLGLVLLCLYVICGFPHMRALSMFCTPHENFEFGDLTQGNAPLIQRYPPTHRFPIGVYAASFRAVLTIDRTAAGDWD